MYRLHVFHIKHHVSLQIPFTYYTGIPTEMQIHKSRSSMVKKKKKNGVCGKNPFNGYIVCPDNILSKKNIKNLILFKVVKMTARFWNMALMEH